MSRDNGSTRQRGATSAPWHKQPAYTTTRRRQSPGRRGPASLVDMAVKLVADNIGCVDAAALSRCHPALVWRVWDYLNHRRRGVNFHAWKTILHSLPDIIHPRTGVEAPGLKIYRQTLDEVPEPLQTYLDPLKGSPCIFLTGVVIGRGARFAEAELLALPRLRNLALLALVQPHPRYGEGFPRVTDRLIREWSLLPDPFPALRCLIITNQGQTTARSLTSVARFLALQTYMVGGRRVDWREAEGDLSLAGEGCWRRHSYGTADNLDLVIHASLLLSLKPPYAKLELGNSMTFYRHHYERQYVFHRVRAGDDDGPGKLLGGLGLLQLDKRKRDGCEEGRRGEEKGKGKGKKGQDAGAGAANAQQGSSQAPRTKRLKGLQDVFQSFGS